ncbi:MAG: SURF1 family protein [Anaerolineae bacterium]
MQLNSFASWPRSGFVLVARLFSRRWWWSTLIVLLGMAVLARLGVWQLDRLEQRKARNAEIIAQLSLPPLPLTAEGLPEDLGDLKYRRATARGEFDFSHQVVLLHQNWMNAPGVHLIAPLVLEGGSQAVLVDRGWLPADQAAPDGWSQFDEPGLLEVTGFIQLSQTLPSRSQTAGQPESPEFRSEWYRVDIEAIQAQMPYQLLPVFILQSPAEDEGVRLPYRSEPEFDLSNGPHLGYALQWFVFALILGIVYVSYVRKKEAGKEQ